MECHIGATMRSLDHREAPMSFSISSPAFMEGASVPRQFTCDGNDIPPPIRVSDAPKETRSFAIVMDDPDAPRGTFNHWLAFDIPAGQAELNPDAGKSLS